MMNATLRRPTGFSDPSHYEEPVMILGYCFGPHQDGRSYNSSATVAQAIIARDDGRLSSVPVTWLSVKLYEDGVQQA